MEGVLTYPRTRFMSALCFTIAGATLALGAFLFTPSAERWLAELLH